MVRLAHVEIREFADLLRDLGHGQEPSLKKRLKCVIYKCRDYLSLLSHGRVLLGDGSHERERPAFDGRWDNSTETSGLDVAAMVAATSRPFHWQ